MQTKSIVQASANVIRIVNLKKGDVYKRIEDSSYGDAKIKYGVIVDLFNDGEKTFVEALEYTKSYSDVNAEIKVFSGDKDVSIFPTTIKEVQEHFESSIQSIEQEIEKDKVKLQEKIEACNKSKEFIAGETSKKLTELDFETATQAEYNQSEREKEEKIRQLKG